MSSQAIGQRLRVSRGGCWQCGSDCRSHLAEVLTFSQMAYNGQALPKGVHLTACGNAVLGGVVLAFGHLSI
jgi:hypothetical protein